MTKTPQGGVHHGRNIKRFRNLRNVKQDALALSLGGDWTQKKISALENQQVVEDELLDKIARILDVELDAMKNFKEEQTITNNQYNYEGSTINSSPVSGPINGDNHFNVFDEWRDSVKKNQELSDQLVKAKEEKIALLEQLLAQKEELLAALKSK